MIRFTCISRSDSCRAIGPYVLVTGRVFKRRRGALGTESVPRACRLWIFLRFSRRIVTDRVNRSARRCKEDRCTRQSRRPRDATSAPSGSRADRAGGSSPCPTESEVQHGPGAGWLVGIGMPVVPAAAGQSGPAWWEMGRVHSIHPIPGPVQSSAAPTARSERAGIKTTTTDPRPETVLTYVRYSVLCSGYT